MLLLAALPAVAGACEDLARLALPGAAITVAQMVPAGSFTPPMAPSAKGKGPAPIQNLPAFCRVAATLRPSSDSDIKIEVWLPASGWNRNYEAVGNGGWAGAISYAAMATALRRNYATSSTDTGHVGDTGSFVLGHPEKYIDFAYRSEHEMAVKAKAIIQAFYGVPPRYSYWNGCSTGGRQGLMEAQRYPDDFDGIIAGASANPRVALAASGLWIASAVLKDPASYIPPAKYPVIHEAAVKACDLIDKVKDGLIEDPQQCRFDPTVIQCKAADGADCLTTAQVEAARRIYAGPVNPRTKAQIYPGLAPGSELGWGVRAQGPEAADRVVNTFRYATFQDPAWNWRTFDFDKDLAKAQQGDAAIADASNADLRPFFAHNGKLLMYHGWNDPQVAPEASIKYYKSVVDTLGGVSKTMNSIRLFMVPGMGHCGGGEGPNTFDALTALEQWVEQGKAPDSMLASHSTNGVVDRTRPLCPYPQTARFKGSGSIDDAANFACKAP
jgi:feruloyl esterase